jgi:hypothetical protein
MHAKKRARNDTSVLNEVSINQDTKTVSVLTDDLRGVPSCRHPVVAIGLPQGISQ